MMVRPVDSNKVPQEVKDYLDHLTKCNNGKWLETNYCDYYPNKVNFIEDKIIRYKQLEDGNYVIEKTFYRS